MSGLCLVVTALFACTCLPALAASRAMTQVGARVVVDPELAIRTLNKNLFGVNVSTGDKSLLGRPEVRRRVRQMGFTSFRFPNGCQADLYNWKSLGAQQVTIDEFLEFCDAVGGEPYYTLNMQGGTEGLQGTSPANAAIDEIIRYRHTAPNPCGYTNYHFGTLSEALALVRAYTIQRALDGRLPILHYEMGNENWGQSGTDWPPEVYARTVELYSRAFREEVAAARAKHPELQALRLTIVAVGYPVMGNNMKSVDTPDRTMNVRWTKALNRLHSEGLIDAVQEHFYPQSAGDGGTLAWAAHNLHNIISARSGRANPRLGGYRDAAIAYSMPLEHTEWNIKCWGPRHEPASVLTNPGFEDGLIGWTVEGDGVTTPARAHRRGTKGLRIEAGEGEYREAVQRFAVPKGAEVVTAGVWLYGGRAGDIELVLREPAGQVLSRWEAVVAESWQRAVVSARISDRPAHLELCIRTRGRSIVYADEAMVYTAKGASLCPISSTTYEQVLFTVDALREMANGGCPRAHLHHLAGDYPCGAMTAAGEIKDLGRAFEFLNGGVGDTIVSSRVECAAYSYRSAASGWATDFNALAPDRDDLPVLSALATRDAAALHLLLINRTADRAVRAAIDLGFQPGRSEGRLRILTGPDFDLAGAKLKEQALMAARLFDHVVEPASAHIISIPLE